MPLIARSIAALKKTSLAGWILAGGDRKGEGHTFHCGRSHNWRPLTRTKTQESEEFSPLLSDLQPMVKP